MASPAPRPARPGPREAPALSGDTRVTTTIDRLIPLTAPGRRRRDTIGGSLQDPTDPVGRLLLNVLTMVAEFEADLISMRTREGMKVAKAKGRLRGKQPKLTVRQEAHLAALHAGGDYPRRARRTVPSRPLHRLPRSTPSPRPQPVRSHRHLPAAREADALTQQRSVPQQLPGRDGPLVDWRPP